MPAKSNFSEKIIELNTEETEKIYHAFIEAYFPENEVKPLSHIIRMMEDGFYKVIVYYDDDKNCSVNDAAAEMNGRVISYDNPAEKSLEPLACAFLTTAPNCSVYLLDYLAVKDSARSLGIGGKILATISSAFSDGKSILIETESVESAETEDERTQRVKRNAFYERNGAKRTGVKTNIFGVEYNVWMLGKNDMEIATATKPLGLAQADITPDELSDFVRKEYRILYHYMLDDELYYKFVQI